MSIQVEPDSQGNITITIKLMIAGVNARAGGVSSEIATAVEKEANESLRSEDLLLQSDSDSSTVFEGANKDKNNVANKAKAPAPYSLRSCIRIEQDDSETSTNSNEDDGGEQESSYEVDYELSQQVSTMRV